MPFGLGLGLGLNARRGGAASDPTLVSQLRFLGTNGSTTFTDDVNPSRVWTPSGLTQIATDASASAGVSGKFQSSVYGPLETPYTPGGDFDISGPSTIFCFEAFAKQDVLTGNACIFGQWTNNGAGALAWRTFTLIFISADTGANLLCAIVDNSSNVVASGVSATSIPLGIYGHVAFYKPTAGATGMYMALNGVVTPVFPGTYILPPVGGNTPVTQQIGSAYDAGGTPSRMDGNVQGFRLWKGSCPYGASNFTPPTPPFPAI